MIKVVEVMRKNYVECGTETTQEMVNRAITDNDINEENVLSISFITPQKLCIFIKEY